MNCDDVQHAVHVPHGTSDPWSPRSAPVISAIHVEKSPASRDGSGVILLLCHRCRRARSDWQHQLDRTECVGQTNRRVSAAETPERRVIGSEHSVRRGADGQRIGRLVDGRL